MLKIVLPLGHVRIFFSNKKTKCTSKRHEQTDLLAEVDLHKNTGKMAV
jgi:hypothetical protein